MANCQYCGQMIQVTDRFCSYCGAPIPADAFSTGTTETSSADTTAQQAAVDTSGDYSVVLVSLGTCAQAAAIDLLEDTMGYAESQARELVSAVPTDAAVNLSRTQAQYIAQAMTEYGMQVSVQCAGEYVDLGSDASSSVFDSAGNFLSGVLKTLGVLTAANRLTSFRKRSGISWLQRLFTPKYKRPVPPPHQRRLFGVQPARNITPPHNVNYRNDRPVQPRDTNRGFSRQDHRVNVSGRNAERQGRDSHFGNGGPGNDRNRPGPEGPGGDRRPGGPRGRQQG